MFKWTAISSGLAAFYYLHERSKTEALSKEEVLFTADEVSKHNSLESLWVSYKGKVYDVTEFAQAHPGGAKNLLLAAGKDLAPFWGLYQQHSADHVQEILARYCIGKLDPKSVKKSCSKSDKNTAYSNEPERHPAMKINNPTPFNGEPPPSLLLRSFITPNELHFIRNRLPVPEVDISTFTLDVSLPNGNVLPLSIDELKEKFEVIEMPVTLMCAGNRRSEFNAQVKDKKVNGLSWGQCAISTARWKGVLLTDILEHVGISYKECRAKGLVHLRVEGLDAGPDGVGTGASIPLERAFDRSSSVLVAFEMNGEEIPRDHGFPLRLVVPGTVGARNIKWLSKISVSAEESESPTQRRDYKLFGPNVTNVKNIPWEQAPSVQYLPVTSAILEPSTGTRVEPGETVTLEGYAYSGAGNGITRVDISVDGGQTWTQTEIFNENDPYTQKSFAWTLWNFELEIPEDIKEDKIEICIRAIDSNCNTQPETIDALWNIRGLLNNSWHRIELFVTRQ